MALSKIEYAKQKKIADKDILYYKALLFKHKIQGHDALCLEESKVIMKKGILDVGGGGDPEEASACDLVVGILYIFSIKALG